MDGNRVNGGKNTVQQKSRPRKERGEKMIDLRKVVVGGKYRT
jgi:hypothetical protein